MCCVSDPVGVSDRVVRDVRLLSRARCGCMSVCAGFVPDCGVCIGCVGDAGVAKFECKSLKNFLRGSAPHPGQERRLALRARRRGRAATQGGTLITQCITFY